ncbi:MAG: LytTR family DNA-binding domain-containing protein, partial [Bacteroidota bacterium]
TPPRFFLTDVEIDGRPTPIRQLTALDAPRNLKFAFKAISYRHQAALKYRYTSSLDSTEWYALSENEFVVHNPGPGAHFIQAQVSLDGERWSPPLRHTFAVTHPTTQYWLWIPFSAALLVGLYLFRTARRQVRAAKAAAQAAAIPNFEFRHEGKRYALPITDILFFKAAGDYVEIVTTHQTWLIRSTMKRLQADTCQFPSFQRVHRSYLVNLAGVEAHDRKELVIGGQVVPVSRAYQGVVWEELSN